MYFSTEKQKPILEYPCLWLYKVITTDQHGAGDKIISMLQDTECTIRLSNTSSGGRYASLDVELTVLSEEHRDSIHALLKGMESVRMVL